MDCLFCKIIESEIPAKVIYEDKSVIVIMNINPNSNGHSLVIPKAHFTDFEGIDDNTLISVNNATKRVKKYLYEALKPDGLVLTTNSGGAQEIKHYHLHLIPFYKDEQVIKNIDEIYEQIISNI